MTTIDFNKALQDAKGASFEALPVGDYDVEVAKTEATTSSNGKPMIRTTLRVVSGPYERRPIANQFVFSAENPQAVAIFFRHMRAFGLTDEFFTGLGQVTSLEPVANALVGRRARVTIGHREWQGETRNEVKGVKPYTGAPPAPVTAGPTGPGGSYPATGGPVAPAALPPTPQYTAGPTAPPAAPAAPVAPPAPAPQPAPVADAPPLPTSDVQVPATPQPPAPPTLPV